MSPILVRPVREQLEHDRLIRVLQATRAKRKTEIRINPGTEQNEGIGAGPQREYPDLVVISTDKGRKIQSIVEVETGESVNHLEALAQWAHYGRLKHPFHLYVPAGSADVARRLCADQQIPVDELWTYQHLGDQVRFTLVQKSDSRPETRTSPAARRASAAPKNNQAARKKAGTPSKAAGPARAVRAAKKGAGRSAANGGRRAAKAKAAVRKAAPVRKGKAVPPKATSTKKAARRK